MSIKMALAVPFVLFSMNAMSTPNISVSSSAFFYKPANTLDGNISSLSRAISYGSNQYLQYDLSDIYSVDSIDIAFYQGNSHNYFFDVLVSNDGQNWVNVYSGQSAGKSSDFETFSLQSNEARYVKLNLNGSNVSKWNQILEVKINTSEIAQPIPESEPVYNVNFDNLTPGTVWGKEVGFNVEAACGTNDSNCLRVTYVPTSEGSERLGYNPRLPPAKEYSLNYDVFFESDFEWVRGGKLPGLGPVNQTTGCRAHTLEGWSVREMWRQEGQPVFYVYDQDRAKECGEQTETGVHMTKETWHAISLYVKVNDPSYEHNAVMELYLDGEMVSRIEGAQLRGEDGDHTLINRILFHTFFGGSDSSWSPSTQVHSRFDNLAVYPGHRVRTAPGL